MEKSEEKKAVAAHANERTVMEAAVWAWKEGYVEDIQALLSEPGMFKPGSAISWLVVHLRQIWEKSPPPSPADAADHLIVEGAPGSAEVLKGILASAHEWAKGAVEIAKEDLRVKQLLREVAHEKTLEGIYERAKRATEGSAKPALGLGLREVWNMRELPEVAPPQYALDGLLLRPAFTIFGGEPGSRKTTLALAVALGAVHSAPVLGRNMLAEGPALILENDTPEGSFYQVLKRLEWGMGLDERRPRHPIRYLYGQEVDLADPECRKRFLDDVLRLRPAVVVIDSFSGAHGADEDKLLDMKPVLQCLKQARDLTGGLIIAIDHVRKRREEGRREARNQREVRGTGSKSDAADAVWIFSEVDQNESKAECVKQRAGIRPSPFHFGPSDPAEGAPFFLQEVSGQKASSAAASDEEEERQKRLLAERILDKLREKPGLSKEQTWALLGGSRNRCWNAWSLLTALDKLRVEGKRGRERWFVVP